MFEQLQQIDTSLFLFLNGHHARVLDYPMWLISGHLIWVPLYLFIIYLSYKKYGKKILLVLPVIILTFAFSDLVSDSIKHSVQRYRPTHNLLLQDIVYTVSGYRGGKYGFVSSHAANTFGVATITFLLLKNKYSWLFFLWPVIVSYSRIYMGVHYPFDIIGGAITGACIAIIMYQIYLFADKIIYSRKIN